MSLGGCVTYDPTDCWFGGEGCGWFLPEGTLCGLAADAHGHAGVACRGDHDPATFDPDEDRVDSAFPEHGACPPGFTAREIGDKDGSSHAHTCVASPREATGSWRDVPAGTVCGLSAGGPRASVPCMGYDPGRGDCPPGTRLRALPDVWTDRLDPVTRHNVCGSDEAGGACLTPFQNTFGADLLFFCEVEEGVGCVDCPPDVDTRGLLCGLHSRFAGGPPLPPRAGRDLCDVYLAGVGGAEAARARPVDESAALTWSNVVIEACLRRGQPGFEALTALLERDEVQDALYAPRSTCRGEVVTSPPSVDLTHPPVPRPIDCPPGMRALCTFDHSGLDARACGRHPAKRDGAELSRLFAWDDGWCWCSDVDEPMIWGQPLVDARLDVTELGDGRIEAAIEVERRHGPAGLREARVELLWDARELAPSAPDPGSSVAVWAASDAPTFGLVYDPAGAEEEVSRMVVSSDDVGGPGRLGLAGATTLARLRFDRIGACPGAPKQAVAGADRCEAPARLEDGELRLSVVALEPADDLREPAVMDGTLMVASGAYAAAGVCGE